MCLPDDATEYLFLETAFLFFTSFSSGTTTDCFGSSSSFLLLNEGPEGDCSLDGLEDTDADKEVLPLVFVVGVEGGGGGALLVATTGAVAGVMGNSWGKGCLAGGVGLTEGREPVCAVAGVEEMGPSGSRAGTSLWGPSLMGFSSCPFVDDSSPFPTTFTSLSGKAPFVTGGWADCSVLTTVVLFLTPSSGSVLISCFATTRESSVFLEEFSLDATVFGELIILTLGLTHRSYNEIITHLITKMQQY